MGRRCPADKADRGRHRGDHGHPDRHDGGRDYRDRRGTDCRCVPARDAHSHAAARLPASAVPIQTARIALTQTAALVRMPPLRWTPVVAIPVVAATVLIPRCRETPGTLISTDTSACAASGSNSGKHTSNRIFSFYLLTLFFLLQWLYQRAYLTTISSMPIFRSFSTALHNLYTVCRRL